MAEKAIKNLSGFAVVDKTTGKTYYGCHQEWYGSDWQRRAGCGPTVASTLYYYQNRLGREWNSKEKWLALMEEVWEYVTPSSGGMPTTKMFYESVLSYTEAKGLKVQQHYCDLPEDPACRPDMAEVLKFIGDGLDQDAPVAFLNLCNGEEQNLSRWHWVTIVALEDDEKGRRISATILDEGRVQKIDLSLWLRTTTKGGGFVYFTPAD